MAQAQKGGQIGVNGEFYAGGQFMANSPETVKGLQNGGRKAKTRRMEIEPYAWAEQPAPNMLPLFRLMNGNDIIYNNGNPIVNRSFNPQSMGWRITYEQAMADAQKVVDAWSRGERWQEVANG